MSSPTARICWTFVTLALAAGGTTAAAPAPAAPLVSGPDTIAGRYLVVLKPHTTSSAIDAVKATATKAGGNVDYTYDAALHGFSAKLSTGALAKVRQNSAVAYVEADHPVRLAGTQSPSPYNLDRIDQRALPLTNSYTDNRTGAGVSIYIIDSGIRLTHNEFGGRAVSGIDFIDGGEVNDCNGHGTHVAGIAGGSTFGVAKQARLVGVRVFNCQLLTTASMLVAGIDWVTNDHAAGTPAVANISLSGAASPILDQAVTNSIADGITYTVAAGNDGNNACNFSPARVPAAITVGATALVIPSGQANEIDTRFGASNFGPCVDLFAPGQLILSSTWFSDDAREIREGTSQAAPHAAGAAAIYLQANPTATPAQVRDALVAAATPGLIADVKTGSPNLMLFTIQGRTTPLPPAGCTGTTEAYYDQLPFPGMSDIHPAGGFFTSNGGTFRGCLDGPDGADFDLYLYKWNGASWAKVATGGSSTPDENVTYRGTAGSYYWQVASVAGAGRYTFAMNRP